MPTDMMNSTAVTNRQTPMTVELSRVASCGVGQLTIFASRFTSRKKPMGPFLLVGVGTLVGAFFVFSSLTRLGAPNTGRARSHWGISDRILIESAGREVFGTWNCGLGGRLLKLC